MSKGFRRMASVVGAKATGTASAADYVRAVASSFSPELISASSLGDIASVMSRFPAALSAHAMFECRLGSPISSSDYSIMLSAADGGQAMVGGRHATARMPEPLHADPAWERAMTFLRRWGDPGSPFYHRFDHVWLEFDVSADAASRDVPSVFFSPRDGGRLGRSVDATGDDAREARDLIAEAVEILAGEPLAPDDADRLQSSLERLPAGAFLFQVGVMCARETASLRLLLSDMSLDALVHYLGENGWTGDGERLREEIDGLTPRLDGITYGVEIHQGIGARIGVECYVRNDDMRLARDRWPGFIAYLIERGLCLPDKGAALLAYQGMTQENDAPGAWPSNLLDAGAFLNGRVVPVLARSIHHVKLSFVTDAVVEAKAYPGLSLGWVTRA